MYQVTFFKNRQETKSYTFTSKSSAINCLESNANQHSLFVDEDQMYASSGGTIPEMEIELTQVEY
jgi:general stress protein 26